MQGFSGYDMYSHHDDAEGDSSADSEDYNKMINFYQNEIKTKNTYTGQKLPKGVSIIIGHANESFLRKDFDDAIELCHEAIRIFPENSEPYHLMSIIYGEKQDMKKSVDFLFISTQLNNQSDKESWWRIADKYYNLKCYKNASYCYGRALKCEKLNVSLLRKKAECYDKLKDWRGAIKYYEKVLNILPSEVQIVKRLAKSYNKMDHPLKGITLLIDYLIRFSGDRINFDIVSILCDLMISKDLYQELVYLIYAISKDERKLAHLQKSITNLILSIGSDNRSNRIIEIDYMDEFGLAVGNSGLKTAKGLNSDLEVDFCEDDMNLLIEVNLEIEIYYNLVVGFVKIGKLGEALRIVDLVLEGDVNEYYDIFMNLLEICEDVEKFDYA
jgi:tetratricopeptide (TPR) repeat protein